jgi:hypothetical protein
MIVATFPGMPLTIILIGFMESLLSDINFVLIFQIALQRF